MTLEESKIENEVKKIRSIAMLERIYKVHQEIHHILLILIYRLISCLSKENFT